MSQMSLVALPGLTDTSLALPRTGNMSGNTSGKNPFVTIGDWTPEKLKNITVVIGDVAETTSDFTRKSNPNNRYWKAAVSFKSPGYDSRIIKMNSCDVPFNSVSSSIDYGNKYIYARLQKCVCDVIVKAAVDRNIVASGNDKRLVSDADNWWMTVNGTSGRVGVIDSDGAFDPKDLSGILSKTKQGVKLNLDLVFSLRLTVTSNRDRTPSDVFSIVPDCSRGALKGVNIDVALPEVEGGIPQQAVSRNDVAPQELIDLLDTLAV